MDVYVGLIIHRVESRLYIPDQILDFIKKTFRWHAMLLMPEVILGRGAPSAYSLATLGVPWVSPQTPLIVWYTPPAM